MKISFIIPTFNRSALLQQTLNSVLRQVDQNLFEVIIIDNGSTDDTRTVCDNFKSKFSNFTYNYDNEPGLLTGRHKGIELSKAEILCFLDDDVEINPKYSQGVIDLFGTHPDVHFATGPCLPNYEIEPPEWLSYFWKEVPEGKYCHWLSLLDLGEKEIFIDPNYVWGLNFCVRKETAIRLGGFHPDCIPESLQKYQGDGETGLTQKAVDQNLKAFYSSGLALKHFITKGRLTNDYFKKRAFYEGVSNSFTSLRESSAKNENGIIRKLKNILWPYYYKIKNYKKESKPIHIKQLEAEFNKSTNAGYAFHQQQFKTDEKVKNWVLKDNFWDYKLP